MEYCLSLFENLPCVWIYFILFYFVLLYWETTMTKRWSASSTIMSLGHKVQSSVRVENQGLHSLPSSIRFTFKHNPPALCDSAVWQPHPLVDLLVSDFVLLQMWEFQHLVRDMLTLKRTWVITQFIPCRANRAMSGWHNTPALPFLPPPPPPPPPMAVFQPNR